MNGRLASHVMSTFLEDTPGTALCKPKLLFDKPSQSPASPDGPKIFPLLVVVVKTLTGQLAN